MGKKDSQLKKGAELSHKTESTEFPQEGLSKDSQLKKGAELSHKTESTEFTQEGLNKEKDQKTQMEVKHLRRDYDRVLIFINLVCVGIIAGTFAGLIGMVLGSVPSTAKLFSEAHGEVVGMSMLTAIFFGVLFALVVGPCLGIYFLWRQVFKKPSG